MCLENSLDERCVDLCFDQSASSDEFLKRKMARLKANPQQQVEAHPIVPTPVPTKHELVEIRLKIPLTEAVIHTQTEPFQGSKYL